MPLKSTPTWLRPLPAYHTSLHSGPYGEDTLGICAMLGLLCVALPVTAPQVMMEP